MQILSPHPKKTPHHYLFTPWQHSCTYTFFTQCMFYSIEGFTHEHSICRFILPLSRLPHKESDYRHILRSICRIIATIYVRRLDANRSTEKPYRRVMESGANWSCVTHQTSNTELISPGQVSASEAPPLQKVVQTITQLIKMHLMTVSLIHEMLDLDLNVNSPDLLKELLTWQIKLYASSSSI